MRMLHSFSRPADRVGGPGSGHQEAAPAQGIQRRRIGDLIRGHCQLTDKQIEWICSYQREHELRFGEAAVELGLARREDVLWALSQQFNYP